MTSADATSRSSHQQIAPGVTVLVRGEEWLVTNTQLTPDGIRINARGLTPFVRDEVAIFHSGIDEITPVDPRKVTLVPDTSPHYVLSRLWLETIFRKTPVSVFDPHLYVAQDMLVDALPYQLKAVGHALNSKSLRPRLLIADAVGLGKTIEIGMILSELVVRGRGERILIVVPNHVLEQMQKEMWNRFALPFVRLDSQGIQRVRQKLPASRNPFTFFNRAIISIDTLKQPKYRAQLEKVRWDAVVLDEAHNVTNAGTQNNQLARILAPNTEALILASATPHNGDPKSFAELIRLLDPTAVSPDGTVDPEELKRLLLRRHRNSPDVDAVVGDRWAKRAEPNNILVQASDEEAAVARELKEQWVDASAAGETAADRLFGWTLVKAFLSSPAALTATINNRKKTAVKNGRTDEIEKLDQLAELTAKITAKNSAKFQALVDYLTSIGVGPKSDTRVVIFSERVDTLAWLRENLTKAMKLKKDQVATMDGSMNDMAQQETVERFKRRSDPLRVLITGDVASEGVNLHAQCHHLVHYDIPWSLIRIQQRNGRIDRYGQEHPPQITALVLDTPDESSPGELQVLVKLLQREAEAAESLADAQPLMGVYKAKAEEDIVRDILRGAADFDEKVRTPEQVKQSNDANDLYASAETDDDPFDAFFADLFDGEETDTSVNENATEEQSSLQLAEEFEAFHTNNRKRFSLYDSESRYIEDALRAAFDAPDRSLSYGGVGWRRYDNDVYELTPPVDLQMRLDYLPQDYLKETGVAENFKFVDDKVKGNAQVREAQDGASKANWPRAHFLGPLHPVTEWATDRGLSHLGNQEIPVIRGNVLEPTLMCLGTWTNNRGQTITRMFLTLGGFFDMVLEDPASWLKDTAGLHDNVSTRPLREDKIQELQALIPGFVEQAADWLEQPRETAQKWAEQTRSAFTKRRELWEAQAEHRAETSRQRQLRERIEEEQRLADQLLPTQASVRPLIMVVPQNWGDDD